MTCFATEVTVAQWNAVMGGGAEGDPEQPVLCTFRDAECFIRAMNALPAASNVVFRIPTEMEWEHGCRSAHGLPFTKAVW